MFTLEERVAMVEAECAKLSQATGIEIVVHPFENLLIDCAKDVGAGIIIRGLRAVADFEYEFQMVGMNRKLDAEIVTVFLMAEADRQAIASKLVKEIARLGGDVSHFRAGPRGRGRHRQVQALSLRAPEHASIDTSDHSKGVGHGRDQGPREHHPHRAEGWHRHHRSFCPTWRPSMPRA